MTTKQNFTLNSKTTCHNFECKKYPTCTYNIWNDGPQCDLKNYMSARQSIYKRYTQSGGTLSYNEYFYC